MKQTQVIRVDDIDGTLAFETMQFAIDGEAWEIDLSLTHAEELREVFEPFAEAGRYLGRFNPPHISPAWTPPDPIKVERDRRIREWAVEHGHRVARTGKIPRRVVEAYESAWR